jgi:hypothetical protein
MPLLPCDFIRRYQAYRDFKRDCRKPKHLAVHRRFDWKRSHHNGDLQDEGAANEWEHTDSLPSDDRSFSRPRCTAVIYHI